MREDIKKRWEMIQRGEIPKGYKKERNKIIPKEWDLKRLDDLVDRIVGGGTPSRNKPHYYGGDIPWATVKDLSEDNYKEATLEYISREGVENSSTKIIEKNNFIISTRMGLGRGFINKVDMAINQDLKGLYPNKRKLDVVYLMYWYKNSSALFERLGVGSTVKGINLKTLKNMMIPHPSIKEQRKIAQILSTWDEAIELKEKLIEEKQEQKKGLMQNLLTGKVRLPGFEGEWEEVKLGEVLKSRNKRSEVTEGLKLYSLTIEDGVTPKTDRYNREFLVKDSNKKYKITEKNDIVYNPSNLRFGAIAVNKVEKPVLLSPIYEVLYIASPEKYESGFIGQLLTWDRQIRIFSTKAEGTLVERMAVKLDAFLHTKILIPMDIQEQKAIANILSTADREIELLKEEVELLKEQKKGLMQLLLTGIVRVKC